MKRYSIGFLALCLAGCTVSAPAETASPSASPEQKETIWVKEPEMDIDSADDLPVFQYSLESVKSTDFGDITLCIETEKTGYPAEWNGSGYDPDAMLVEKGNRQGFYKHDGSELYAISMNKISTPFVAGIIAAPYTTADGTKKIAYGAADMSTSKTQIFNKDFKDVTQVDLAQFGYDFKINARDPYLAYKGDTLGIAGIKMTSTGAMSGWEFEPYQPTGIKENMIVPVIDDQYVIQSYCIVSPDGTRSGDLNQTMKYRVGSYVNGYYVISDGTYTTIIEAGSGTGIAVQYQDAKYFEDNYAPVKKNGKWGYVDKTGKEVTDFIFDDACTVYDGYAWVKFNDRYGVLAFQNTLDDAEKQINAYWCAPSDEESIGKLTVQISELTIRKGADATAGKVGTSMNGAVYPVFEIQKSDSYTWYRINAEDWVANDGTWATYEAGK
jgi:hypothetical protein